jgi:hypothetical protein
VVVEQCPESLTWMPKLQTDSQPNKGMVRDGWRDDPLHCQTSCVTDRGLRSALKQRNICLRRDC